MKKLAFLLCLCMAFPAYADKKAAKKAAAKAPKDAPLYSMDSDTQKAPANTALARITKASRIRVCVRADVPPFGYFSQAGLKGFELSLVREVVTRLSIDYKKILHVSWIVITAKQRVAKLQDNSCDLVAAAFSYTKDRAKHVGLSKAYLATDKVLVSAAKITRKTPVIAQVKGTTGSTAGVKGKVQYYNSYQDIIFAMDNGEVDYVITDRPIATHMIRSASTPFKIAKVLVKGAEKYVLGVNKNNKALLGAINAALEKIAQSGRLSYLHLKWL